MAAVPSRAEDWRTAAACGGTAGKAFFKASQAAAVEICRGCPVRPECLYDGLTSGAPIGVWGGLTSTERRALPALLDTRPAALAALGLLLDELDEQAEAAAHDPSPVTDPVPEPHAARREAFARTIYEHWNPDRAWEDAHADDVIGYRADADVAIKAADAAAGITYELPLRTDVYQEIAERLHLYGETPKAQAAGVTAIAGVVREWGAHLDSGEHQPVQLTDLPALALKEVRRLCNMTIAVSMRVQAIEQAHDTLAIIDRVMNTGRPRCPHCQLPHDLTSTSLPVAFCESTRQRIADAARLHGQGDHQLCCRADCEVLRARDSGELT